jgi:hypothetical protein
MKLLTEDNVTLGIYWHTQTGPMAGFIVGRSVTRRFSSMAQESRATRSCLLFSSSFGS